MMSNTNIACAQIDCLGRSQANLKKIISTFRSAAERDAKLVMFPECALTGTRTIRSRRPIPFAEPIDGPSSQAFAEVCRKRVHTRSSDSSKRRRTSSITRRCWSAGRRVGGYRKVHLPFIGIDRFPTPGDRQFEVFDLPFGKSA
jgi:predicted amidohydrolase